MTAKPDKSHAHTGGPKHKKGHFKVQKNGKKPKMNNEQAKIKLDSSEQSTQKQENNKRSEKRAMLKSQKKDQPSVESATCLLLRNLPPSINYNMLKTVVPKATQVEIYKKGSKRHAFANFESHKACTKAMKKLNGFKLDDHEISVKIVNRQPRTQTSQGQPPSLDKSITLSNLPFSITKAELEEEFPTASEVILNVNKNGRFRGSCLLVFENADDCKIVWDACRGRKIGGRLVYCRAGACFVADRTPTPIWGVKLRGLPVEVTNAQLASLFPKDTLIKAHCDLNFDSSSKTGLLRFSTAEAQRAALRMLNTQKCFGVRIRCRPWIPQKVRSKPLPEDSPAPGVVAETPHTGKKSNKTEQAPIDLELPESDNLENTVLSEGSPKKKRKRNVSASMNDVDLDDLSTLTTSAKKKRRHSQA